MVSPTLEPTTTTTEDPSPFPTTRAPVPSDDACPEKIASALSLDEDFDCQPTSGTCASTPDAVAEAVSRGDPIVSLCDDATFTTPLSFTMTALSLVLCCQTQDCTIEQDGDDRNLYITVSDDEAPRNLTLSGIRFRGGRRPVQDFSATGRGGNVLIEIPEGNSGTNVLLQDCIMEGGIATDGGNLYVDNTFGQVTLRRCTLSNGDAFFSGGGAYINAEEIILDETSFDSNAVTGQSNSPGGGLVADYQSATISQEILIYDSTFFQNLADGAAGMFASSFGALSTLQVVRTTFEENRAVCAESASCGSGFSGLGAVGMIFPTEASQIILCENEGLGNTADSFCDGLLLTDTNPGDCLAVENNFP